MATWKKVGENLVRHSSASIYLQAEVAGKKIRRSLKTDDLATAKLRRDKELKTVKKQAVTKSQAAQTIQGALERIDQIIESIRSQKKAPSEASAGLVGFPAFSGCRLSEARAVRWSDLDTDWTWLAITGGKLGTKNSTRCATSPSTRRCGQCGAPQCPHLRRRHRED